MIMDIVIFVITFVKIVGDQLISNALTAWIKVPSMMGTVLRNAQHRLISSTVNVNIVLLDALIVKIARAYNVMMNTTSLMEPAKITVQQEPTMMKQIINAIIV